MGTIRAFRRGKKDAYTHYRNGLMYYPLDECKIQVEGEWVPAVIYCNDQNEKFCCSVEEFLRRFHK